MMPKRVKTESGILVEFIKQSGLSESTHGNEQIHFHSVIASEATNFFGASDFAFEREKTHSDVNQEQKIKDHKKSQIPSTEVTQVDHTRDENVNNKDPLIPLADEEAFSVAGPSEIHTQSHGAGTGKRFVCGICGNGFGSNFKLLAHHRMHTGEKPFVCRTCGKGFTQQSNLTRHLWTHTGEKPFACHICCKGFARTNNLACHLRTYTGEKPYKCKLRGMAFEDKRNCILHQKRMHDGK
ncbi:Histone-lysine N-methyltransferase PRDM9 [Araneus ventricosus]|uniref:Histone-lysine N-methyltransferase PRDM9 n=1 Tax=Araneus ventricosus TaxID=182803 RepID=A0A4Y2J6G4_ARAVE|nr:Histone-lysine N-methyltransferase PRDM9 [Araneus ventricosus]